MTTIELRSPLEAKEVSCGDRFQPGPARPKIHELYTVHERVEVRTTDLVMWVG